MLSGGELKDGRNEQLRPLAERTASAKAAGDSRGPGLTEQLQVVLWGEVQGCWGVRCRGGQAPGSAGSCLRSLKSRLLQEGSV